MYASNAASGIAAMRARPGVKTDGTRRRPVATSAGRMGSVSALAIGAIGERTWKSVAIIGSVPTWAAHVTAKGSRRNAGMKVRRLSMVGVSRMIAAVPA